MRSLRYSDERRKPEMPMVTGTWCSSEWRKNRSKGILGQTHGALQCLFAAKSYLAQVDRALYCRNGSVLTKCSGASRVPLEYRNSIQLGRITNLDYQVEIRLSYCNHKTIAGLDGRMEDRLLIQLCVDNLSASFEAGRYTMKQDPSPMRLLTST